MKNQYRGFEAENFVMNYLRSRHGIRVNYIDSYYDIEIEINNEWYLLEIKSCQFKVCDGKENYRFGRFQFPKAKNRVLQRKNKVYILFVLNVGDSFQIIGMKSARSLNQQKKYINLIDVMQMQLFNIDKFINNKKSNNV